MSAQQFSIYELLNEYSHLRVATEADNEEILEFCAGVTMNTSTMALRYDRTPDYFAFLKEQSRDFFVFAFLNKDGSIGGIASVVLKQQYVKGKLTSLAYLCDLRTAPQLYRLARVQWRTCYSRVVAGCRNIKEFQNCQYFYSAVFADNQIAQDALVKKQRHYVYRELGSYDAISLIYRKPWQRIPQQPARYRVDHCSDNDIGDLRKFLHQQAKAKVFGENFAADQAADDELQRRLQSWDNFSLSSFIVVRSTASGEIIGCVAPWLQEKSRRLVVSKLSRSLLLLSRISPLMGRSRLAADGVVRVLSLTHFEIASSLSDDQSEQLARHLVARGV